MFLRISKTEKTGVIIGSIFTSWSEGKTNGPWTVPLKYLAGLRKSSVGEESRKSRAGIEKENPEPLTEVKSRRWCLEKMG